MERRKPGFKCGHWVSVLKIKHFLFDPDDDRSYFLSKFEFAKALFFAGTPAYIDIFVIGNLNERLRLMDFPD